VWDVVDSWIENANEADCAWLREKIRVSAFSRRAVKRKKGRTRATSDERARTAYEKLEPKDPVLRHEWLFRSAWVDESWDELADEDFDFRKREERISKLRKAAMGEILGEGGVDAALRLAEFAESYHNIGWSMAEALNDESLETSLRHLLSEGPIRGSKAGIFSGALHEAERRDVDLLSSIVPGLDPAVAISVLLAAPFNQRTWALVDSMSDEIAERYWEDVSPNWGGNKEERAFAAKRLVEAGRPRAAFSYARVELKELPARDIFNLLRAIAQGSKEPPKTYMLEQYSLKEAFKLLNKSGEISTDEMAGLEFAFIDIFDHEGDDLGLVNLESQVEAHPELFVQAVGFAFKRDDDQDDPPELLAGDDDIRSKRASAGYKLLDRLKVIPGHNEHGDLVPEKLVNWIEQVRAGCYAIARGPIGDQMIGKLLSHAPVDADGIWPCLPVRDALEQVTNEEMGLGIHVALRNSRGVHWRGEGGAQERELAAKYGGWAKAMEYTHPHAAAILRSVEESYLREAEREDNEAKITRRMRF
jgi:hypothetical protein